MKNIIHRTEFVRMILHSPMHAMADNIIRMNAAWMIFSVLNTQ